MAWKFDNVVLPVMELGSTHLPWIKSTTRHCGHMEKKENHAIVSNFGPDGVGWCSGGKHALRLRRV